MAIRELGQYRDAHLEIEALLRKSGPILESAVQTNVRVHASYFTQVGPDLRHRLTGQTIEEWVAERRKTHKHDYADFSPDDPDQVLHTTIEEACLRPSPKTLGVLYKAVGERRYQELLRQWGTDPVRMLPGERPGYAERKAEKADADAKQKGALNPWSKDFVGTDDERIARQTSIIRQGTKFAASMAASAGVTITGAPLKR